MGDTTPSRIVVGVSGSRASLSALRWGADEARLRGACLHVIRAWDPTSHAAFYAGASHVPTPAEKRTAAHVGLATALRSVFGPDTPSWVTAELAEGVPERTLIARSADARLLVLGVTTPAVETEHSEGPVVRACLLHALCPVVIVAAESHESARQPDLPASPPACEASRDSANETRPGRNSAGPSTIITICTLGSPGFDQVGVPR
jgi:nucleotide-binding universal stress UspA family protein